MSAPVPGVPWEDPAVARRRTERQREARPCGICDAQPGQECDTSVIAGFEGMHFARREEN